MEFYPYIDVASRAKGRVKIVSSNRREWQAAFSNNLQIENFSIFSVNFLH